MIELERAKIYLDNLDMIPDELLGTPNDLVQLLAVMVAKVEELTGLLNEASNSFDRITELRWGYDGDCGATNIAELAIDDIQAALKQEGE